MGQKGRQKEKEITMSDTKPEVSAQEAAAAKEAEFQGRVKEFNAEMMPLLKKYRLGIGASAFLMPDGRVGAGPRLYDDTANVAKPAEAAAPAEPASAKMSEG
jgi:hypothetical protein